MVWKHGFLVLVVPRVLIVSVEADTIVKPPGYPIAFERAGFTSQSAPPASVQDRFLGIGIDLPIRDATRTSISAFTRAFGQTTVL